MARVLIPYRYEQKAAPYAEAMRLANAHPVPASVADELSLDGVQGLLLTGGTDLDPQRYGQAALRETEDPDRERDEVELRLVAEALERDLPILAICRGLQLLNVQHGGTLHQHLNLPEHDSSAPDQSEPVHSVLLEEASKLAQIYEANRVEVNSRHHQAVDRVGQNLRVAGRSEREPHVIEALESPTRRFVLGVQWHPEDMAPRNEKQLRLFQRFARACG